MGGRNGVCRGHAQHVHDQVLTGFLLSLTLGGVKAKTLFAFAFTLAFTFEPWPAPLYEQVSCISGCTCQPKQLEGLWQERSSQPFYERIYVSPAQKCILEVCLRGGELL